LVFVNVNKAEFLKETISPRRCVSELGFMIQHEEEHFMDLARMAPLHSLLLDSFLFNVNVVKILSVYSGKSKFTMPLCKYRIPLVFAAGSTIDEKRGVITVFGGDIVFEGHTLYRNLIEKPAGRVFHKSIIRKVEKSLRMRENLLHNTAFLYYQDIKEHIPSKYKDKPLTEILYSVINLVPFLTEQLAFNRNYVDDIIKELWEGKYVRPDNSWLKHINYLVFRRNDFLIEEALELKDVVKEEWNRLFVEVERYIERQLEDCRNELIRIYPFLCRGLRSVFNDSQAEQCDVQNPLLDLPVVLMDGLYTKGNMSKGSVSFPDLSSQVIPWFCHFFETYIIFWYNFSGALRCPLYTKLLEFLNDKSLAKQVLNKVCNDLLMREDVCVEPSGEYCCTIDPVEEILLDELKTKKVCLFWQVVHKTFFKYESLVVPFSSIDDVFGHLYEDEEK
jgi:hypothetical protein